MEGMVFYGRNGVIWKTDRRKDGAKNSITTPSDILGDVDSIREPSKYVILFSRYDKKGEMLRTTVAHPVAAAECKHSWTADKLES